MEFLNYHHLRYFWSAAKEGSVRKAAEKYRVSQPSISKQIHELEEMLGEALFQREGRANVLTDAGQVVYRYADEIFSLGNELVNAVKQRPTAKSIRLHVGVADSFPKLVTSQILKPVFNLHQAIHVVCREGKVGDLLSQLALHQLDIVLADEPVTSSAPVTAFSHLLGSCEIAFCAAPAVAEKLKKRFPQSLHGAPALLPTENTGMRRALEKWFVAKKIQPSVVAEFEDAALMKVMAADGKGFLPVPALVAEEATLRYGMEVIGTAKGCREEFYSITVERRTVHPGVAAILGQNLELG